MYAMVGKSNTSICTSYGFTFYTNCGVQPTRSPRERAMDESRRSIHALCRRPQRA
jgi:hypothetical protein